MNYFALMVSLLLIVFCFDSKAEEKAFVASATNLDVDAYEIEYDVATITISGSNGFFKRLMLDASNTKIDFDKLGMLADGHYKYQIEYANNGGVEFVTDKNTGRDNVVRNLGQVKMVSGYFNVKDSEFVSTTQENEIIAPEN